MGASSGFRKLISDFHPSWLINTLPSLLSVVCKWPPVTMLRDQCVCVCVCVCACERESVYCVYYQHAPGLGYYFGTPWESHHPLALMMLDGPCAAMSSFRFFNMKHSYNFPFFSSILFLTLSMRKEREPFFFILYTYVLLTMPFCHLLQLVKKKKTVLLHTSLFFMCTEVKLIRIIFSLEKEFDGRLLSECEI